MAKRIEAIPVEGIDAQVRKYLKMIRDLKENDVREEYLTLKKQFSDLEQQLEEERQKGEQTLNQLNSTKESLVTITTEYTTEKNKWQQKYEGLTEANRILAEMNQQLQNEREHLHEETVRLKDEMRELSAKKQSMKHQEQRLQEELVISQKNTDMWKEKYYELSLEYQQLLEEKDLYEASLNEIASSVHTPEGVSEEVTVSEIEAEIQISEQKKRPRSPLSLGISASKKKEEKASHDPTPETPVKEERAKSITFRDLQGKKKAQLIQTDGLYTRSKQNKHR